MKKVIEALDPRDQITIMDYQKDILDIKQQMVDTDNSDLKTRLKGEIDTLQKKIQSIKDAAG